MLGLNPLNIYLGHVKAFLFGKRIPELSDKENVCIEVQLQENTGIISKCSWLVVKTAQHLEEKNY